MAAAAILKNHKKIEISQQRIGRSSRSLARLCKMGLLTAQTVNKFKFLKSKMADGRQYENVKSPYLRNRLTDSEEIWHVDADWPPTGD